MRQDRRAEPAQKHACYLMNTNPVLLLLFCYCYYYYYQHCYHYFLHKFKLKKGKA